MMHGLTTNIVAAPGLDTDAVGATVYWEMRGYVNMTDLRGAWADEGLNPDLLPNDTTPSAALSAAAAEEKERRLLVRPLGDNKGWALVTERPVESTLKHTVVMTIKVNPATEELSFEPDPGADFRNRFGAAYRHHRTHLVAREVGSLMADQAKRLGAVALRECGGFYFVPRVILPEYRRIVKAVKSVSSHHFFAIPAMRGNEAVDAVLHAMKNEAAKVLDEVEKEVNDGLGARALRTRSARCEALVEKLAKYEALLGGGLADIAAKAEELKAQVVVATLAAEAAEQASEAQAQAA